MHVGARFSRRRVALGGLLLAATAWAFVQGAHGHGVGAVDSDLSGVTVSRSFVIDASTGELNLRDVQVGPGEVVEFLLDGSAGAPHNFVLQGAARGSEIDTSFAPDGDTVVRLRVPADGGLSFTCTLPGHDGLHGSLVVDTGA